MLELLSTFSIEQILIYTIMLAFAIKGVVDLCSWAKEKYNKKFNKDYTSKKEKEKIEQSYETCTMQLGQALTNYKTLEEKIDKLSDNASKAISDLNDKIELLTTSDMHAIKGWIVEKHHLLMKRGWVDDFTMDTLEYRYSDYKKEHGNSYVDSLMEDLRDLPHTPGEDD